MGVPVVNHLAELAREHALVFHRRRLAYVLGPVVHYVIIIGHGSRPSRVGVFVARYLQGLQGEVLGIACFVQYRFP